MTGRASARAAFVIAAGFLSAASAPAAAEPSDNEGVVVQRAEKAGKPLALTKPVAVKKLTRSHARAKLAARSRKAVQVVAKSERRKNIEAKAEINRAAPLPTVVADARAELPAAPAGTAPLEVAAADQMNVLDRALNEPVVKVEDASPAPTVTVLAVRPAPQPTAPAATLAVAEPSNPTPWDQSSLVGKCSSRLAAC